MEDWLGKVEESMLFSLRKAMKVALMDHQEKDRTVWVLCHASQVGFSALIRIYDTKLFRQNFFFIGR